MPAKKPHIHNPNECALNHRPIIEFAAKGRWDVEFISHTGRYSKAVDLILTENRVLKRGVMVLDVGCGDLWPLRALIGNPFRREDQILDQYTALDMDDPDISFVTKRTPFTFIHQDLSIDPILPAESGTVDVLICLEVIEHMMPDFVIPWLEDMNRVVRPGGLLYISTPNADYGRKQPKFHPYEWGYQEMMDAFSKHWEIVAHHGTFMRQATFKRINRNEQRVPDELAVALRERFGAEWFRCVTATFYPEYSENVAWIMRKP